jgi:hypothetical protein
MDRNEFMRSISFSKKDFYIEEGGSDDKMNLEK